MAKSAASVARFKRRLAKIPVEVRAATAAQALLSAATLVVALKGSSPKESGRLASSVRLESARSPDHFLVKAGGQATTKPVRNGQTAQFDYSVPTEYGREDQPARKWFWPTINHRKPQIRKDLEKAALDAAKRLSD